jgi:tRNA 2-thiouridine synthesizing protein A
MQYFGAKAEKDLNYHMERECVEVSSVKDELKPARTIDCMGLYCPEPLFQTRENIDQIEPGEILEVITDDPAAEEDLKRFAKRTGHEVVSFEKNDDHMRFLIKKKE